jgi:hypothetical protein
MALTRRVRKKFRTRRYKKIRRVGKTRRIKYRSYKRRYVGSGIHSIKKAINEKDNVVRPTPQKEEGKAWSTKKKIVNEDPKFVEEHKEGELSHKPIKYSTPNSDKLINLGSVPYNNSFGKNSDSFQRNVKDISFSSERRKIEKKNRTERKQYKMAEKAAKAAAKAEEAEDLIHSKTTYKVESHNLGTLPGETDYY